MNNPTPCEVGHSDKFDIQGYKENSICNSLSKHMEGRFLKNSTCTHEVHVLAHRDRAT